MVSTFLLFVYISLAGAPADEYVYGAQGQPVEFATMAECQRTLVTEVGKLILDLRDYAKKNPQAPEAKVTDAQCREKKS